MATRIKALASFSNKDELSHLPDNYINQGETTVVRDFYATQLKSQGLVEVIEEDVATDEPSSIETDSESEDETEPEADDEPETEESDSESSTSEVEGRFTHTELVDADGSLAEDFPHAETLADNGIETFDDLAEFADDFTELTGIGPAYAEAIEEAWDEIAE